MIQYILECMAFQLVFLVIYDFFLKKETFFHWNRVYLIGTYVLSLLLPWIKIEALKTTVPENYYVYPEFLLGTNTAVVATAIENAPMISITWQEGVLYGGMLLAAVYFGYKLYQLYKLSRTGSVERFPNFTRIVIKNSELAFSFFRSIFLGDKIFSKEHGSIIKHELVHIEQRHSLDLLFFELMRIVGWFNPLVYVYQNRIAELHEFIADAHVPKAERKAHYDLLLSQIFKTQNISFVNQFFKSSLIKKRIVMLQKSKSKKVFQLKYLLLLPLVFGMLAYSSTSLVNNSDTSSELYGSGNDAILIAELREKIDKKIQEQGSISNVFLSSDLYLQYNTSKKFSKEEFFEYKLLHKGYVIELLTVTYPLLGEKVSEEMVNEYRNLPLPTSIAYAEYLESSSGESENYYKSNILGVISFEEVENVPVFPGCENDDDKRGCFYESMRQHIRKNFNYPKEAQERGIQGRVNTMFIINEQGEIIDVTYRGPDILLTNEAERIISRLPKMQPGVHKGKKVKVTFSIPITFKLKFERTNQSMKYDTITKVPFSVVDEIPVFPGCDNNEDKRVCFNQMMQKHISKNFRYPKEAQEKGIQGRVNIMFIIGKDGIIKGLRMRGPDKLLEGEAKRIIELLPTMKPGKQKGKIVDVPYSIPISFRLNTSPIEEESMTQKYNELLTERKRLLKSTNEKNPIIISLDEQIEGLENLIMDSIKSKEESELYYNATEVPFAVVDEIPVFPGCENTEDKRACFNQMVQKHISKNFRYPKEAQEKGIQGRVNILFTIGNDGIIKGLRMRGPDVFLEGEAKRIIELLPTMIPGKHGDKEVDVPFSVPISFVLESNTSSKIMEEAIPLNGFNLSAPENVNALYFVDGIETSIVGVRKISPTTLESLVVLRGKAAEDKYGDKGKNDIIEITLKKKN